MIDEIVDLDQFWEIKNHCYYSSEFGRYTHVEGRTRAFEPEFWPQLNKLYSKLRSYNYTDDEDQLISIERNHILNQQAQLILSNTELAIRVTQNEVMAIAEREREHGSAMKYLTQIQGRKSFAPQNTRFQVQETRLQQKRNDSGAHIKIQEAESFVDTVRHRTFQFKTPRPTTQAQVVQSHQRPYEDEVSSDQQKSRGQPRQSKLSRSRMYTSTESKASKILKAPFYEGNQWDRVLSSDEYRILYYLFRTISLGIDMVKRVDYGVDEAQPRSQYLRRFSSIYTFLQLVIVLAFIYAVYTWW